MDLTTATAKQVIDTIRERVKAGPSGWEDITGHGYAYHETMASYDVQWVMDIIDKVEEQEVGWSE